MKVKLRIGALIGAWALGAAGCTSTANSNDTVAVGEQLANQTIQRLMLVDPDILPIRVATEADGTFHHIIARKQRATQTSTVFAVDSTGTVVSLQQAQEQLNREHFARWGAIGIETASQLLKGVPGQPRRFLVLIDTDSPSAEEAYTLASSIDPTAFIHRRRPAFVELVSTQANILANLAFSTGVQAITLSDTTDFTTNGIANAVFPSSALTTSSKTAFNDDGVFGSGVPIGVVELPGNGTDAGCEILHEHEAFTDATVTYQFSGGISCNSDIDCKYKCDVDSNATCVNGVCRAGHTTSVASRISSYQGSCNFTDCLTGPFHAASADLYFPQTFAYKQASNMSGGTGYVLDVDAQKLSKAYDWLVDQKVQLFNESWGGDGSLLSGFSLRAIIADSYARDHDLTIVQASGNFGGVGSDRVTCDGLNTICVGGFTSVEGSFDDWQDPQFRNKLSVSEYSRWKNKAPQEGRYEMEKPDLVAEGFGRYVHGASAKREEAWLQVSGTSFAAPVVTGLAAMMWEYCDPAAKFIPSLATRAIMRNASEQTSIEYLKEDASIPDTCPASPFLAYPTADSRLGCDYKAGAGLANAHALTEYCDGGMTDGTACPIPGVPCRSWGEGSTSPDEKGKTPGWLSDELPIEKMTANGTKASQPLRQASTVAKAVREFGKMPAGMRVRGSLSFFSCPGNGPAGVTPAANFDFALCGQAAGEADEKCLFVSESLDDTNEGFDVRLPADFDTLTAYLIKPSSWTPCNGNPEERYGYAFSYGW